MLNSVVEISMMSAKYFEYYTIILRGAVFSWTHCRCEQLAQGYYTALPRVGFELASRDLLIASPTLYPLHHHAAYKKYRKVNIKTTIKKQTLGQLSTNLHATNS